MEFQKRTEAEVDTPELLLNFLIMLSTPFRSFSFPLYLRIRRAMQIPPFRSASKNSGASEAFPFTLSTRALQFSAAAQERKRIFLTTFSNNYILVLKTFWSNVSFTIMNKISPTYLVSEIFWNKNSSQFIWLQYVLSRIFLLICNFYKFWISN